jgi:hypothetical protein
MGRMLQALKNLEARSPRPADEPARDVPPSRPVKKQQLTAATAAKSPVASLAAEPLIDISTTTVASAIEVAASLETAPRGYESIDSLAADVARLQPSSMKPAWPQAIAPDFSSFLSPFAPSTTRSISPAPDSSPRAACEIERFVRMALADPLRARPLRELADRLHKDLAQTGAKTIAFIGLGSASLTHEPLVYLGTVLAEQGKKTLLVDAEFEQRSLSESLDYAREEGLSELLRDAADASRACRPTSAEKLWLLPAGQLTAVSLGGDEARPAKLLERLATEHDCVLLDVGRAGNPAAPLLARMADAAYFVVRLGAIEAAAAQAALAEFRACGARVLGCIAT